ncbi:hypothetical protein DHEL01_v210815 [Diaporthe helianthi]|uniref:Uncharacterized protein n=1 Tax=Diaporthe helianthi TaxID=158607 RepID=A0A2P5HKL3_DIAHE|nr:hypothetical protein DHEL01_v210815 [Diaporthe helianthi]
MMPHIEGASEATLSLAGPRRPGFDPKARNASTTLFYLLTPGSPQGGLPPQPCSDGQLPTPGTPKGAESSVEGLLMSETVVPGFEYCDHDFLPRDGLERLLGDERAMALEWLVRRDD